jgi:phage I-like protein
VNRTLTLYSLIDIPEKAEEPLPREFRLLKAGLNTTRKGPVMFDAAAAKAVMAAYSRDGVRRMIDLEHLSLNKDALLFRADAADARGWCSLELRDGELYSTGVTWCPDGERRLRDRTQIYTSPAILGEEVHGVLHAREILNIAIVAMPATHGTGQLMAASARDLRTVAERATSYVNTRKALSKAAKVKHGS